MNVFSRLFQESSSSTVPSSIFRMVIWATFLLCCVGFFESDVVAQDYRNSVASTDFDYIHSTDPSAFKALEFDGKMGCEMPDKTDRKQGLIHPAFVFVATFTDGTNLQMSIDAGFGSPEVAEAEAKRYLEPMGKLPTSLRKGVDRVVVHQGGNDATAFSDNKLIVLYSDNATKRISNHDLEETIFHESVHASWDKEHANSEAWQRAQAQDGGFVTMYAKQKPSREDLAESALFAYTLIHHPERIPAADAKKIKKAIPARIRFVGELLPPDKPIFYAVAKEKIVPKDKGAGKQGSSGKAVGSCKVDLTLRGQLSDVMSNALIRELGKKKRKFSDFLKTHGKRQATQKSFFR